MTAPSIEYGYDLPLDSGLGSQRQFKKHKILPRPGSIRAHEIPLVISRTRPTKYNLVVDTSQPRNAGPQPSSPRTLKHHSKRIGSGPDLPPTPPRHSRKSSSNSSGVPSSPTIADSNLQTPQNVPTRPPVTPPNQQSPPTPDVTPPQPTSRPRALRPILPDRGGSRATTADSRTDSFRTAREEPFSSEDEERRSSVRPTMGSTTSQSTVRRISEKPRSEAPKPNSLGHALATLNARSEDSDTSRTRGEFGQFDGDWSSVTEVEQEWDDNLQRMVTIKKRNSAPETPRTNGQNDTISFEHENPMRAPANATKPVRNMTWNGQTDAIPSPRGVSRRGTSSGPSSTETSVSTDARRSSAISTRSTISTVVEAILVNGPPQRQKTLRHVRKQVALRHPIYESPSSTVNSFNLGKLRDSRLRVRPENNKHESYASNSTVNSVSSGKARREVRKSGGIPVVIVPDRRSSKSSKEPSLRSTSSRRSNRTLSVSSIPLDTSTNKDVGPVFSRPSRRSRAYSDSDGSDERTMDFPPAVPARSSSLSAPTSRNVSRASSLTAESIKIHNTLQESLMKHPREETQVPVITLPREMTVRPAVSCESEKDGSHRRLSIDRHDASLFAKGCPSLNTPFSVASMETSGTAPVVSEAQAVHMYPHQNSSVLVVDHSARPSEESDENQRDVEERELPGKPKMVTTKPTGDGPVTPPQPQFSLDDIDSPLRNPRAPPEPPIHPPAINFIPATPSGMTPANEKMVQMGNYFEATGQKPPRRPSLVRRALTRRRHSVDYASTMSKPPGRLTRTFSLSRNRPHAFLRHKMPELERGPTYPNEDDTPAEENKLHPFWRPQWSSEEEDGDYHRDHDDQEDFTYRYPPVDNRPQQSQSPKRSFSEKVKRTFAILPPREDEFYPVNDWKGPERRTIRRTPSGNLRVMRHRASIDSLRRNYNQDERPRTAPDEDDTPFWRGNSIQRRAGKERRRFSISGRIEEIQNIPRRISEKRREKRSQELRQKISGPREVRDGVGEVVRSSSFRDQYRTNGRS
ncbi:Fc.00g098780.m01.CDS01 [Cosmosporella sp. VM-42]